MTPDEIRLQQHQDQEITAGVEWVRSGADVWGFMERLLAAGDDSGVIRAMSDDDLRVLRGMAKIGLREVAKSWISTKSD